MPLTFMHQALLVAVTQTPITVFINYAGMTERCRLLSHARRPAVRWKTLWDSSISYVACSSCSHFAFSLLKKLIAPFYEKIIHREIWFTDCYVFTLLYPLKNIHPLPLWSYLISSSMDIFWKIYIYLNCSQTFPLSSLTVCRNRVERPGPFYHLNDINVNGRQTGGGGGEAPNQRTHFLHAFFVPNNEW